MNSKGLLLVVCGLPGAGKTTLARRAAAELGATYLRIDTIEETIAASGGEVGPLGYTVAYALALDNLLAGLIVVADCVNAIEITRAAWHGVAGRAGVPCVDVEILCSDTVEHRRRIEARLAGGRTRPTWAEVAAHEWQVWTPPVRRIETAGRSEDGSLADLLALVRP